MQKKQYDFNKRIREKTEVIFNRHLYCDIIDYHGYDTIYKEKFFEFIINPVSYTHLTLPTSDLV